jgi:hypothetical protein
MTPELRADDVVDSDFLYQHVLGDDFVEFLKPRMKGGNYPAVTGGDVASYPTGAAATRLSSGRSLPSCRR